MGLAIADLRSAASVLFVMSLLCILGVEYIRHSRKKCISSSADKYSTQQQYMFANVSKEDEAHRLFVLNRTHTPETMQALIPILKSLPSNAKALEIGCGEGSLALEVAKILRGDVNLFATDSEAPQVALTQEKLIPYPNATALQANFISDYENLKDKAPFNLIYCRWVICHIAMSKQEAILASLLKLLAPGGSFVMDDCDNRLVEYRVKEGVCASSQTISLAENATRMFTEFYDPIAFNRELNLKRDADSMKSLLDRSSEKAGVKGRVELLREYQVVFQEESDKQAVTLGKISASASYARLTGNSAEPFIQVYRQAASDPNICCEFLGETVISFTRT